MRYNSKLNNGIRKKGQFTAVITILLALVVMYTFTVFYGKLGKVSDYAQWKTTCTSSIADIDLLNTKGRQASSLIPLAPKSEKEPEIICPTYHAKSEAIDKIGVMSDIANYMYDCWSIFRKGDVNIFGWDMGDQNYCVICQNIAFKTKEKIKIREFSDYLAAKPIPTKAMTYSKYFAGDRKINTDSVSEEFIDTSKTYDVVFTYRRMVDYNNPITMELADALTSPKIGLLSVGLIHPLGSAAIAGGAAIGTGFILRTFFSGKNANWTSGIEVVPSDATALKQIDCDIFPLKQQTYDAEG